MQFAIEATHLAQGDARRICLARQHAVAGTVQCQPEHVEADTDVTNRRGRECRHKIGQVIPPGSGTAQA